MNDKIEIKTAELSIAELDCVAGGGIIGDALKVIQAAADAVGKAASAVANAIPDGAGSGAGSGSGSAATWPKSTWL